MPERKAKVAKKKRSHQHKAQPKSHTSKTKVSKITRRKNTYKKVSAGSGRSPEENPRTNKLRPLPPPLARSLSSTRSTRSTASTDPQNVNPPSPRTPTRQRSPRSR